MTRVPWEGTIVKSKRNMADKFQCLHIRLEERQNFWKFRIEKSLQPVLYENTDSTDSRHRSNTP